MTIKGIIKRLVPPILIDAQRAVRGRQLLRFIWKGVYPSFREVPAFGLGHDSPGWIEGSRRLTEHFVEEARRSSPVPRHVWAMRNLMPLVAAIRGSDTGRFTVLDFGGGMGTDYVCLRSCLGADLTLEYHIVENERSCALGEELFRGDARVHFHRGLPAAVGPLDMVYSCGALQYVEDFSGLIERLAAYQAPFFMLVSLPVGAAPRFASAQVNFADTVVPCWFFNREELLAIMSRVGYRPVYVSCQDRVFDMSNFPQTHQVPQQSNWLFVRTASA